MKKNITSFIVLISILFTPFIGYAGQEDKTDKINESEKTPPTKKRDRQLEGEEAAASTGSLKGTPPKTATKKVKTHSKTKPFASKKRNSTQLNLPFLAEKKKKSTQNLTEEVENDETTPNTDRQGTEVLEIAAHQGKGPKQLLHIYLLKENLDSFRKALKPKEKSKAFKGDVIEKPQVAADGHESGLVIQVKKKKYIPSWAHVINSIMHENDEEQSSLPESTQVNHNDEGETTSAIIFIEAAGRKFAITFGNGRHLLKKSKKESMFAIHAVLNNLDYENPHTIKAFGLTFPRVNVETVKKSYSIGTGCKTIPRDSRQILHKINGARQKDKYKLGASQDCLCVEAPLDMETLPSLCASLFSLSEQTNYQKHFAWVDDLTPVSNTVLKAKLNNVLFTALAGDQSIIFGSASRPVVGEICPVESDEVVQHYTLSDFPGVTYTTPEELTSILSQIKQPSFDAFKKHVRVTAHGPNGEIGTWKLYNSLLFDTVLDGKAFILNWGKWYQVNPDLNKRVNEKINAVFEGTSPGNILTEVLPEDYTSAEVVQEDGAGDEADDLEADEEDNTKTGSKKKRRDVEQAYNKRIARNSDGKLLLMDCRTVKGHNEDVEHKLGDRIEVFDLLSTARQVIHVKNYTGSSTFSHLCAQALVSAKNLKNVNFRNESRLKFLKEEVIRLLAENKGDSDKTREEVDEHLRSQNLDDGDKILLCKLSVYIKNKLSHLQDDQTTHLIDGLNTRYSLFTSMLNSQFKEHEFTITLAFFHPDNRKLLSDYLPFFSRVNLSETIDNIQNEGYKVSVQHIKSPKSQ